MRVFSVVSGILDKLLHWLHIHQIYWCYNYNIILISTSLMRGITLPHEALQLELSLACVTVYLVQRQYIASV